MNYITKIITFDAGHRLTKHKGKCYGLHGHTYHLEVTVQAEELTPEGFVIDFADLKEILKTVVENEFDHKFLLSNTRENRFLIEGIIRGGDERISDSLVITGYEPTVENIAKAIYKSLSYYFKNIENDRGLDITKVKLFETPTSYAEVY